MGVRSTAREDGGTATSTIALGGGSTGSVGAATAQADRAKPDAATARARYQHAHGLLDIRVPHTSSECGVRSAECGINSELRTPHCFDYHLTSVARTDW